jgi:hypothetical protein
MTTMTTPAPACPACYVRAAERCARCGGCECDCSCWDEASWARSGLTAAAPAADRIIPGGPGNGPGQPRPGARARGCPVGTCRAPVGAGRLMCRPHWYQVPKRLRDQVWAAWHSGAGVFSPAYRSAVGQAIAAAQAAAGKDAAS